ncbi:MAG: hypothetical protein EXX96DRAFT_548695 [Benjaminiella poitrasii]|nr:MAG: hypothetical protein EXX96DRAFT_548695 [Benjaminiella poitrasii]
MEAIICKYMLDTKSPNCNDFVGKNERNIINLSTTTNSTNAFKLMTVWINKNNKTIRKTRPLARLQKKFKRTTITFKGIYTLIHAQETADSIVEAASYKTSTAYVLKTNKALRDSTNNNPLDNNAKRPSVIQVNEPDEGKGEGQQVENEGEQDAEEQDEEGAKII